MSFNGVTKPYITVLEKIRPPWAPIKRNILSVKGLPGGYLEDTDTLPRPIGVKILIENKDYFSDLNKLKEDLAAWLITDGVKELVFDDELDRTYFAAADATLDLDEMVSAGQGIVYFICPDPYKYGPENTKVFTNVGVATVSGSKETEPTFTVTIDQDTTYVSVYNESSGKINLIGNPVKQEETAFDPETSILITTCNTLTGWTTSSSASIEGPTQLGTLKTNGDFYSDSYGTLVGQWHGPAMKTSLSQALEDFRFDVGLTMQKTGANQAGGIEVDLLDASSKIIAKVTLTKHHGGLDNLYPRVRAGTFANGHDVINENEAIFQGAVSAIFRVTRKDNVWTAQIFYAQNGVYKSKIVNSWTDDNSIAAAAVTQVQARLFQRGDFPVVDQKIADINVYRLNDAGANQVPIIAKAGDKIVFDHKTQNILKNGESVIDEKAFIGDYFTLKPGSNVLVAEPADAISSVDVRWRNKWH
jgi:predicted phage tail component-like protein